MLLVDEDEDFELKLDGGSKINETILLWVDLLR